MVFISLVCRGLSEFDRHDFGAVGEHLELVPGGSLSDLTQHTSLVDWDCSEQLHIAHTQLVKALTLAHTAEDWKRQL